MITMSRTKSGSRDRLRPSLSRGNIAAALSALGLATISAAGFAVTTWLGLLLAGLGLLVISWMVDSDSG
jgi:hypothetical protein